MRTLPLLLLTVLASCSSVPPHRVDAAHGTVFAFAPDVASEISEALEVLAPAVRSRINSTYSNPPVVHVPARAVGPICYQNWIEFGRPWYEQEDWRFTLYHELVHWYAESTWVSDLPLYLEEGVADYLSCEYVGGIEARAEQIRRMPTHEVSLSKLDGLGDDIVHLEGEEQLLMYQTGFHIVYTVGLDRLREATLSGPVTPTDVQRMLADSIQAR